MVDSKVREAGRNGAEIPLQPMQKTMGKQCGTLQHPDDHVRADYPHCSHGRHWARAGGCALNELQTGEAMQDWVYPKGVQPMTEPMLEQGRRGGRRRRDEVL